MQNMIPKKIIIDVRLLGKGGASGIEEYTRSLLDELFQTDKSNEYLLFYNGYRKVPLPLDWQTGHNVYDGKIPNKALDMASRLFKYPKVESFLTGDLVFSPHFNILATNLPQVVTFHDLSFVHHPDFFSLRRNFWHWLQNIENTARQARKIIAVSEFTKSDLVELFHIKPENIEVIYSGINPIFKKIDIASADLGIFRKKHDLSRPFILYLGTIEPRKNIISIIRAFDVLKKNSRYQDFELIIAGQAGWLYEETLKLAGQSKAKNDIKFLGKILPGERVLLYNLASVFVYPSFFEGFGFPPLEAQACGVPVIASNRTSLPEVLGNSAILVDPWRLTEIVDGIKTLIDKQSQREELIQAGFLNTKKFTWGKATKATSQVFSKI